ncbi:hypothetical protein CLU79DRAFT_726445 [Phycomyces nitens]|nr:hypothetical protein CLU79DRAFT_726445 [Phycomyces nitens]
MFTPICMPATCELCGNWLPDHNSGCPREGVHPSQWSLTYSDDITSFDVEQDGSHHHLSFSPQTPEIVSFDS